MATREAELDRERLDDLFAILLYIVTDLGLTDAQKDLVLAKQAEIREQREARRTEKVA